MSSIEEYWEGPPQGGQLGYPSISLQIQQIRIAIRIQQRWERFIRKIGRPRWRPPIGLSRYSQKIAPFGDSRKS